MEQAGENLVGDAGERFDEIIEAALPEAIADEAKQAIRQRVGKDLEEIDKEVAEIREDMDSNALSCSGILKMRASKGDVTYTVSVCTSPKVYLRDGPASYLPLNVQASSANKLD